MSPTTNLVCLAARRRTRWDGHAVRDLVPMPTTRFSTLYSGKLDQGTLGHAAVALEENRAPDNGEYYGTSHILTREIKNLEAIHKDQRHSPPEVVPGLVASQVTRGAVDEDGVDSHEVRLVMTLAGGGSVATRGQYVRDYAQRRGAGEKKKDVLALWKGLVDLHASGWVHGQLLARYVAMGAQAGGEKGGSAPLRPFLLYGWYNAKKYDSKKDTDEASARYDVKCLFQATFRILYGGPAPFEKYPRWSLPTVDHEKAIDEDEEKLGFKVSDGMMRLLLRGTATSHPMTAQEVYDRLEKLPESEFKGY